MQKPLTLSAIFNLTALAILTISVTILSTVGVFVAGSIRRSLAPADDIVGKIPDDAAKIDGSEVETLLAATRERRAHAVAEPIANPFKTPSPTPPPAAPPAP